MASDETLFVANLYQNPSQFSPTSCSQVVSCFNPYAPVCRDPATGQAAHYSNLRVHNFRGESFTPSGAEGAICDALVFGQARGGEIGDVQVVEVGSEERVVATSMTGSLSPSLLVDDFPPAWITIEKVAGLWEVDQEASLFAGDLRSSNPVGGALCVPGGEPVCSNTIECPAECTLGPPLELGDLVLQRCSIECEGAQDCPTGSGVPFNLPGRLPRPAGTAIRVWNSPPNPMRREFYLPIGVIGAGTNVGDLRDNWILRLPVDPLIEASRRLIDADVPARAAPGEDIGISLTFDSTDPLVGSASGLYVGKDGELVAVDEWTRVGCSAGSCTYEATIDGSFNQKGDFLDWHGVFHIRDSGALHVAGIVGL